MTPQPDPVHSGATGAVTDIPTRRLHERKWARRLIFAFVLALVPAYYVAFRVPAVGLFHDDAIYVVTAKALAEGKGYHIISLPSEPPQTKYPPVLPLVLSVIWTIFPSFPDNLAALKLVPLAAACVWIALSVRLLGRLGVDPMLAWAAACAVAAVPWVMFLSTSLLSETLFAALYTGTLLSLESVPLDSQKVRRGAVLAALATLTRTIGVGLLVACVAWMLSKRQYRQALIFGVTAGLLLLPWIVWTIAASGEGYYSFENYRSWNVLSSGYSISQKAVVILRNLVAIAAAPAVLAGVPLRWLALAATAALFILGVRRLWRRNTLTLWFVAIYMAIAACWAWSPFRFIVVILPAFLWVMMSGLPVSRLRCRKVVLVALMACAALSFARSYHYAIDASRNGVLNVYATGTERWDEIQDVCAWIRNNTSQQAILVGNLDPLYYLFTGRKALRGFEADSYGLFYSRPAVNPVTTPAALLRMMRTARAGVLVDSPDYGYPEREYIDEVVRTLEREGRLNRLWSAGQFTVFRPIVSR